MRHVFDRKKLIVAIQPLHINKLMMKLELTPHQQVTFWLTEPNVDRLLKIRDIAGIDPLDYMQEAGPRYKKK